MYTGRTVHRWDFLGGKEFTFFRYRTKEANRRMDIPTKAIKIGFCISSNTHPLTYFVGEGFLKAGYEPIF